MPESLVTPSRRGDESSKVEAWRAHVLTELGFEPARALELAENPRVDVRYLEQLLARGATLEQAAALAEREL